jgi:signal transduction histidine kinase
MFDKLFPFHFALDRAFNIVQKGSSLSKIVPDVRLFDQIFNFKVPHLRLDKSFNALLARLDQMFVIDINGLDLQLQGQFVFDDKQDLLFFCGNPWLSAETDIKKLNLNIGDFALHSSVIENADFIKLSVEELNTGFELNEEFENQQKFFETLFDEIPVDMSIIDMEHRFRYLNKQAVKDDNLRKWMVGKTNLDYFILKNYDKQIGITREAYIQTAIETNSLVRFEDVHHKGTEKEVVMLRSVSPFSTYDDTKYLLAYGLDITDIKNNIKIVEQKNTELEKLNRELNSVIYSITHDFRSPILAVKALVELMRKSMDLNPRFEGFLDLITNSIDRLDDQIIDIYHFVKNTKTELLSVPVDLNEIVCDIFKLVEHAVPYPIKLKIDIQENDVFYTDAYRLKIILNNLISNAVKYSSNRHNNAFVEFGARVDENECNFYVRDNGEGISEDLTDKVFEIYFRANNKVSGTGLGLFICYEAVKKLNGSISLESKPGEGSTFRVTIPNSK